MIGDPKDLPGLLAERISAGDVDGAVELYDHGALMASPTGVMASGAEAIHEQIAALVSLRPRLSVSGSQALVVGELALVSARWRVDLGADGQASEVAAATSEVARRNGDGGWRLLISDPSAALSSAAGGVRAPAPEAQEFTQLIFAEQGPVVRLTLNRPERRNALSMQLSEELMRAIERVRDSETIQVLVIDGAGETFSAGDDISEMALWGDANQIMQRVRGYQRMADAIAELDKITVALVDGFAVGGGLEITMACDFVIAADRAKWGMPEVDVGITPGWGGTTRMARLIGRRKTKEINLLGALHPAATAVELGLWNRVVPTASLREEGAALVEVLLSKNQQAMRQLKFIIDRGVEADLATAQGFEALSAGLTGAVNGVWRVADADQGSGILSFVSGGDQWRRRRRLAADFWVG
jgi:enoyl-CoA hydratase